VPRRAHPARLEPVSESKGIMPGLIKGLATTARTLTRHAHVEEYPDHRPELPARTRGVIALLAENCTSCMLCARECPDWCIYIDAHKESIPAATPGGRERQRNVLDRFAIDYSLCMYCGICVEVCPFDALFWSPQFEYAELDIMDLLHEKDRLQAWVETVPPPPAPDPNAGEVPEVAAQRAPARGPRVLGRAAPAGAGSASGGPAGGGPAAPRTAGKDRPARPGLARREPPGGEG